MLLCLIVTTILLSGCRQADRRRSRRTGQAAPKPAADSPEAVFEAAYESMLDGKIEQAILQFGAMTSRPDRGGAYADDAQFWLAYCQQEAGQLREAWEGYHWLVMSRPNSAYAAVADAMLKSLSGEMKAPP
jgi:TolA-binding protein